MNRPYRSIVALMLTVIYTLIIMGPLAPLALKSPRVAHAVTGECSGNCDICGCSAERRADRTCCCWLKKRKKEQAIAQARLPDCCKKRMNQRKPVISCDCPCGDNKLPALLGGEKSEQLPYIFCQNPIPLDEQSLFFSHVERLADLHCDPPEPPPRLSLPA